MNDKENMLPDENKKEEKLDEKEITIPEEVLEKIPKEARSEFKRTLSTMISAAYMGPAPHPFTKKLTGEHITKIIDNVEKDEQRQFEYSKGERKMSLTIFFGILIPVTGLIIFFTLLNKVEILVPLISAIIAFGGGYGFGKSRK
jgi:hypothetical protein